MATINGLECCGVNVIDQIADQTPKSVIEQVCESKFNQEDDCAFYIFTDIQKMIWGTALASYIRKENLGIIRTSVSRVNPNSGNTLKIWIWHVNHTALKSWAKKHNSYHESY